MRKNLFLVLVLLFSTGVHAFPEDQIFMRLQAQQMGLVSSKPQFHIGEKFYGKGVGPMWQDTYVTEILAVNADELYYRATKVTVSGIYKRDVWVDLHSGQVNKAVYKTETSYENSQSQSSAGDYGFAKVILSNVSQQKISTPMGEKECKIFVAAKARPDNYVKCTYVLCESLPGTGFLAQDCSPFGGIPSSNLVGYQR